MIPARIRRAGYGWWSDPGDEWEDEWATGPAARDWARTKSDYIGTRLCYR